MFNKNNNDSHLKGGGFKPKNKRNDAYDEYVKSISHFNPLSLEEEKENLLLYKKTGNEKYRNRLIEANLKYVVKIANQYKDCGIPLIDLISEGNEGLFTAIDKFDYDKANVKIITYAVHWIKCRIREAISELNQKKEEYRESQKLSSEIELEYDDLDNETNKDEEYAHIAEKLMVCLDERELKIIKKLFGIGEIEQKSIREISEEMLLSHERVSQLRDKAILKMQSAALTNDIKINFQ